MDSKILPSLDLKVGDKKNYNFSFDAKKVTNYMAVSGDTNPIHWNEDYTALTFFKKPIIHGTYLLSMMSGVLGTKFPGKGTVVTSMQVDFLKPVSYGIDTGVNVILILEVTKVKKDKATITFKFIKHKFEQDPEVKVITGSVDVMNVFDITRSKACQTKKTTPIQMKTAQKSQ